ncbi:MAG TPA: hypothetical protein ENJ20_00190 [Bacteroidetes bacterium]|nr:hypothetical protein [Bacteroidota bacterium]
MKKFILIFIPLYLFFASILYSQSGPGILFSLHQLPDQSWGVFLKPREGLVPTLKTMTGTGQITLVVPEGFEYCHFKNYSGSWAENARVECPGEAPGNVYISFGLLSNNPKMYMVPNAETLLFSFETEEKFNGTIRLLNNGTDPFSSPDNSWSSNPGNDILVADYGYGTLRFYSYQGNYSSGTESLPIIAGQRQPNTESTTTEGMVIEWFDELEEDQ